MSEWDKELEQYYKENLIAIKDDCIELLKQGIEDSVDNVYSPSWYDRTNQLKDAVTGKIEGDTLYVYIDTDKLNYHSWVNFQDTGKKVGEIVPWLVESGHMSRHTEYSENQYNSYEPRYYLEKGKQYIMQKYGVQVEIDIINNKPEWV